MDVASWKDSLAAEGTTIVTSAIAHRRVQDLASRGMVFRPIARAVWDAVEYEAEKQVPAVIVHTLDRLAAMNIGDLFELLLSHKAERGL